MRKTILVKGPAFSRSGYGEQTRFALRSLRSREDLFDIYLINIPWGRTGFIAEDDEERAWLDHLLHKTIAFAQRGAQCMCSLQITIPNEWEKIAPIDIGFTAGMETTKVAPEWIEKGNLMDKIIVVSNHSKKVYESTVYQVRNQATGEEIPDFRCTTPIGVANYPVRLYEPDPIDLELSTDFNFITVAQMGPRKNIANTLKWFIEEFHDEEVGLIMKTNAANDSIMDRHHTQKLLQNMIAPYPDKKCKIYFVHGSLTAENLTWLYQHPKIKSLVSISHGEGFGLPLFEAAYNGLPIITALWSGQNDFLFARNKNGKLRPHVAKVEYTLAPIPPEAYWEGVVVKDSMWAYPDETSYKRQLREVYKSPDRFRAAANKLQKHILKEFTTEKMMNNFCENVWQEEWGSLGVSPLEQVVLSFE